MHFRKILLATSAILCVPVMVVAQMPGDAVSQAGAAVSSYSLLTQQPITRVPYAQNPNSITTKRLPTDVMNHLAPNSDPISVNVLQDNGGWGPFTWNDGWWGLRSWSTPGLNDCCSMPLYYATANDPWYVITGCDYAPAHSTGPWNPIGIPFHAPNQAEFNLSYSDNYLGVWDQSQNYLVEFYEYGHPGATLPACGATSASDACPIHMHSCAIAKFDTSQDWGGVSSTRPGDFAPFMGVIRLQELMQGQINHALFLDLDCVVSPPVFPDVVKSMAWPCGVPPAPSVSNRPREGSLFFLDYSDAQIQSMNIPQWQKTVLTAFAHYGGYAGTTGLGGSTISPYMESGQAYSQQHVANPFPQWAASQPGVTKGCNASDCRYVFRFFDRVPWVNGPTCPASSHPNGCDLSHHLHIADPCVAAGLANQPANASTPPCVWPLTVQIVGSGTGSLTSSLSGVQYHSGTAQLAYVGKETPVTLTAKPSGSSTFQGWSGACSGANPTCTIRVTEATSVTANFR
jgi:hypothetical protein